MDGNDDSQRWQNLLSEYKQVSLRGVKVRNSEATGTKILKPDRSIFTVVDFDYEEVDTRVSETAFLNAGLKITITDEVERNPCLGTPV